MNPLSDPWYAARLQPGRVSNWRILLRDMTEDAHVLGSSEEDTKKPKISLLREPYLQITLKGYPQPTSPLGISGRLPKFNSSQLHAQGKFPAIPPQKRITEGNHKIKFNVERFSPNPSQFLHWDCSPNRERL